MHPCVLITFALLLLRLETRTANQLVAVGGGGGGDDNAVLNKCSYKETQALLDFKDGLQDPTCFLSTWIPEDDCCNWIGVWCNNQNGHVTKVDLSDYWIYNATGVGCEIRNSLLNLSYLSYLDLSTNSFDGNIPTFIGSMTRLRYLDLSHNSLNGIINRSVVSLTKLRYLNLGSNNLSGTIPRSIGSLTKLTYLSLNNNSFSGTIPLEIGNLTNLQTLFLGDVGICRVENLKWLSLLSHLAKLRMDGISLAKQNHWVDVILRLRKLTYLSLTGCDLSQVMYPCSSFLNFSSSIESLYLENNSLNSSMYHWLLPLTSNKLRKLYLSRNTLHGIPKYLGNLCSLEVLKLDNNSAVVKFPDFLNNLSGCTSLTLRWLSAIGSQFNGSVSDEIEKFPSLVVLNLSKNRLDGTISEKLWELPSLKFVHISSNYLRGAISKNIGKSKAIVINLSRNSLQGVPSTDHMSNLSYVYYIDLSFCKLGPRFPKWIQTLKNLTYLNIADSRISDTIPVEFWDMWPSQLGYMNLSSNNITGKVPDLLSNFGETSVIDLSSNSFYGPIPNVPSTLVSLDLSRNKFSGGISFLCQIVDGFLEFLDLSHNFLTGQLPDCLWQFQQLKVLNLGHNSLFGRLPASIGSLIKLEALYLYKNDFSGELPVTVKNCTSLSSLNLGANNFSGKVPVWIGEKLPLIYILILTSNRFFGEIPLQLCQLANLQILDLSRNHLYGTIPSCLNNLTSMVQQDFLPPPNVHPFSTTYVNYLGNLSVTIDEDYVDHAMIEWQGEEREFIRNLGLLKSIDLSSNNLTGQLPIELTGLYELVALNLSNNVLLGEIPQEIGEMKKLLTLDLSRNNFSGQIPSSISQMSLLNDLDVSFNNLSGRIPSSTQLQSFQPSRYDGNLGLCGPPLAKKCPGDEDLNATLVVGESKGDGEDIDELWGWFYIGGGTGFATGFWIVCGALLLNRRLRHAFFHFYDSFKDWVYVKVVVVFIASLQRVAHA